MAASVLLDVLLLEPGTVEREAPTSSSPVGPGRGAEISKVRLTIPGPGPGRESTATGMLIGGGLRIAL